MRRTSELCTARDLMRCLPPELAAGDSPAVRPGVRAANVAGWGIAMAWHVARPIKGM